MQTIYIAEHAFSHQVLFNMSRIIVPLIAFTWILEAVLLFGKLIYRSVDIENPDTSIF